MLENISENSKALFLRDLMQSYVGQQGLGSMPKADLDALIIHLYLKYSGTQKVDVFALSETFKIKESRVKSLVETGWIKFSGKDEVEVWLDIISSLSRVSIELESLEKGQVRFKLENPAHFRYFQKQVRLLESTASYSPSSEQVVTQFDVFNKVINRVYQSVLNDSQAQANDAIKAIYRRIRNDIIGPERFESYRTGEQKKSPLGKSLSKAAELAGIASLVISVFGSNPVSAAVALKDIK
ncbi:hypothetical protein CXF85_15395 [Colwellia sp. 75C3]|uniref:hypothetical protein n=1 Tax=Colwellia sp. 75C3 TaxID=888425 RepID=UPI000C329B8F|nr:hypothetical protein [Colwellia sp. 75C3]PKG81920.1 hypothetical protein CXF85_15395 [Colwellia sp. 75C3]